MLRLVRMTMTTEARVTRPPVTRPRLATARDPRALSAVTSPSVAWARYRPPVQ